MLSKTQNVYEATRTLWEKGAYLMILSMENVENEQHQVRYISTQTGFSSAQGKSGGKPSVGHDKSFRSERQAHHLV